MNDQEPPLAFRMRERRLFEKWIHARNEQKLLGRSDVPGGAELESLRDEYRRKGFLLVEQLLSESLIDKLGPLRKEIPDRTVTRRDQAWTEHNFPKGERIPAWLLEQAPFAGLVEGVTGRDPASYTEQLAWFNQYEPGHYIPEHTDNQGDVQVLIGVHLPDVPEPQGMLEIGKERLSLRKGDLLIFRATEVPHRTYPIEDVDEPRLNITVRYGS